MASDMSDDEITIDWNPGDGWLGERKVKVNWIEFPPMGEDEEWAPLVDPSAFGTLDEPKWPDLDAAVEGLKKAGGESGQ